jgi:hypothetical protein
LSDAYLAKLDGQGHILSETTFDGRSQRKIYGLVALASGDVVLVGEYDDRTWLARVTGSGRTIWERQFGLGLGASVIVTTEKILVAGFAENAGGSDKYSRADIALWTFDEAGKLLDRRIIRDGSNYGPGPYRNIILSMTYSNDAVYIFSSFAWSFDAAPLEVSKLDGQGGGLWRKALSETRRPVSANTVETCGLGVTVLSNGNPLVVCSIGGQITLFDIDSRTGEPVVKQIQLSLPPASCGRGWPGALFLKQRDGEGVWVFGSRGAGTISASCTWLGRIASVPSLSAR